MDFNIYKQNGICIMENIYRTLFSMTHTGQILSDEYREESTGITTLTNLSLPLARVFGLLHVAAGFEEAVEFFNDAINEVAGLMGEGELVRADCSDCLSESTWDALRFLQMERGLNKLVEALFSTYTTLEEYSEDCDYLEREFWVK